MSSCKIFGITKIYSKSDIINSLFRRSALEDWHSRMVLCFKIVKTEAIRLLHPDTRFSEFFRTKMNEELGEESTKNTPNENKGHNEFVDNTCETQNVKCMRSSQTLLDPLVEDDPKQRPLMTQSQALKYLILYFCTSMVPSDPCYSRHVQWDIRR
jgi:hypothetical protein